MTKRTKILLATLLTLQTFATFGQTEFSSDNLTGKWIFCTTDKFFKDYKCVGDAVFEFSSDGTYKEYRKGVACYNNKPEFLTGTWTLTNGAFVLKEDQWCKGMTHTFPDYKIKWLNKNVFYSVGREGKHGPKVFTYFTRKE